MDSIAWIAEKSTQTASTSIVMSSGTCQKWSGPLTIVQTGGDSV
jgi:hypothetical protein